MSTERLNGSLRVRALRPEQPFGPRPRGCLARPPGAGRAAVLPWSARGWRSGAEHPASWCSWSGHCCFCSCRGHAAVAGRTARVSAHPIPLPAGLAGGGMLWLGSPLTAGAEMEESPDFMHPSNALSIWIHILPPRLASLQPRGSWGIFEAGAKKKAFPHALVAASSGLSLVSAQRAPASMHRLTWRCLGAKLMSRYAFGVGQEGSDTQ